MNNYHFYHPGNYHIHLHITGDGTEKIFEKLDLLTTKIETVMSTQAEIAAQLNETTAQLQKIATESAATLQKVADLEAALANQSNVTPELQTAFDALKAQVQTVDDLVPDAA